MIEVEVELKQDGKPIVRHAVTFANESNATAKAIRELMIRATDALVYRAEKLERERA